MQDAQQQLLAAQTEAARVHKARTMMEVETLRISQRIEILNNISTQATLLAGSSIAFLGGEALETVDDHETWLHIIGKFLYVAAGALALTSSLWVIVVASHLIALTRDASLRKNILKASRLLDQAMKEVRGVHQFALCNLLLACLMGALLNMQLLMSLVVTVIFTTATVQVACKQQYISMQFFEEVELEPEVAAVGSARELLQSFIDPMRPRNVQRVFNMWDFYQAHVEEQEQYERDYQQQQGGSLPPHAYFQKARTTQAAVAFSDDEPSGDMQEPRHMLSAAGKRGAHDKSATTA